MEGEEGTLYMKSAKNARFMTLYAAWRIELSYSADVIRKHHVVAIVPMDTTGMPRTGWIRGE